MSDDLFAAPLAVSQTDFALVISVGLSTLEYAAEHSPYWWQARIGKRRPTIVDRAAFARAVCQALTDEDEIGATCVTRMLDRAISAVVDGTLGADDDGVEWVSAKEDQ